MPAGPATPECCELRISEVVRHDVAGVHPAVTILAVNSRERRKQHPYTVRAGHLMQLDAIPRAAIPSRYCAVGLSEPSAVNSIESSAISSRRVASALIATHRESLSPFSGICPTAAPYVFSASSYWFSCH